MCMVNRQALGTREPSIRARNERGVLKENGERIDEWKITTTSSLFQGRAGREPRRAGREAPFQWPIVSLWSLTARYQALQITGQGRVKLRKEQTRRIWRMDAKVKLISAGSCKFGGVSGAKLDSQG